MPKCFIFTSVPWTKKACDKWTLSLPPRRRPAGSSAFRGSSGVDDRGHPLPPRASKAICSRAVPACEPFPRPPGSSSLWKDWGVRAQRGSGSPPGSGMHWPVTGGVTPASPRSQLFLAWLTLQGPTSPRRNVSGELTLAGQVRRPVLPAVA